MAEIGRLLFLFMIGAIGLLLRFIFLEKFAWNQLFTLLLFPVGALILWLIMRWQILRDSNFNPIYETNSYHTHMGERYSSGKKVLFKGKQKIGEFHRFYPKWWQRVVNEILEGDGKWYMNLSFNLHNESEVRFIHLKGKKIQSNESWHIVKNEQLIGKVTTDCSLKNATKLKEGIILEIDEEIYYFTSFGIGSETKVVINNEVIATGGRSNSLRFQYHFDVKEGHREIESLLVMTYILFNYVHNQ